MRLVKNRHFKDIHGQWFGELFVLRRVGSERCGVLWYCLCSCGGRRVVVSTALQAGTIKGCKNCAHNRRIKALADNWDKNDPERRGKASALMLAKMNLQKGTTILRQEERELMKLEDRIEIHEELEHFRNRRTSFMPKLVKYTK